VRLAVAALLLALAAGGTGGTADAAEVQRPAPGPGRYADALRETVYVQSTQDQDHDGHLDLIATDIIRPRGTVAGLRVPVLYEASPYYGSLGRGAEHQDKRELGGAAAPQQFPLAYDNLLVPLGYAVVLQDSRGTRDSEGCPDVFGPREVRDSVATVRWLSGRGRAFRADGSPVLATWSTGHVAMTGKSYDATLALATASTGVAGLDSVIAISPVTRYYDYSAEGGLVGRSRRGTPEAYLPATTVPGDTARAGSAHNRLVRRTSCRSDARSLVAAATRTGGDVGPFDDARDLVSRAGSVHASVWLVHGLYDDNVRVSQALHEWSALRGHGVRARLWLHQAGHADPFDVRRAEWLRALPRWLDSQLRGAPADTGPAVQVEQTPGHWVGTSSWPVPGAARAALPLSDLTGAAALSFTDHSDLGRSDAVAATPDPSRVVLRTPPLGAPLHLSGAVSLRLTVTLAAGGSAPLSAYLVEEAPDGRIAATDARDGSDGIALARHRTCVGQGTPADTGCFLDASEQPLRGGHRLVTEGHLDAAHHLTLRRATPLRPGVPTPLTVTLQPVDVVVPAGHRLVLVLAGTEAERFVPGRPAGRPAGAVLVSAAGSSLSLPAVGGPAALARSLGSARGR